MATSVTDSAFEGFRLTRDRPLTLVGWAIFGVVAWIPLIVVIGLVVGPVFLAQMAQAASGAETTTPDFTTMFGAIWAAIGVMVIGFILINAIQTAAIYRSVLKPAERGWAYLRIGADEFRLVVLSIAMFLLWMIAFGGAVLLLMMAVGAAGDAGGILIGIVGGIALTCLAVWIGIRLSLAAAITFAEGRISLFGSWGLTKDRFWPIFGMYLLVFVFTLGINLLGSFIAQIFSGMGLQPLMQSWAASSGQAPDPASINVTMPLLIVSVVGYVLVAMVMNIIQLAVSYAPQAALYRYLTGPAPETTSEVFS